MARPTLTPEIIRAATLDAGNAAMRKGGRTKWSQADYNVAARENNRLWDILEGRKTVTKRKKNPALHSVKVIGSNMTEADHGSLYILYSYETPVAIRPREGVGSKPLVTKEFHSRTTSKHIGVWLRTHGYTIKDAERLPQDMIEAIAKRGYYTKPSLAQENPRRAGKRELSVFDRHQLKIAQDTLKMNDAMVRVMGGPSKAEARKIIERLTGKAPRENPAGQLWYPGGVGIGQDQQGNYMAIPIETTIGWDAVTLRGMFPEGFDAMKLGVFEARLGYEFSGQRGYSLFKVRVGGKWSKPMRLRTVFTSFPGTVKQNPVRRGRGKFVHVRKVAPGRFVQQSFRTVKTNGKRVIVGHLKGEKQRTKRGRTRLTVQAVLRPRGRKRTVGRRANPTIGILGNPPRDGKYLGKVSYIEYLHGHDGQPYYHHFKPAVYAQVRDDGSVVLWHPTNNLWKLFPVSN